MALKYGNLDVEDALFQRYLAGDRVAFESLISPYLPKIERLARSYERPGMCWEDLVQESLIKIWRVGNKYEKRSEFSTFIYRVVNNLLIDMSKKDKKERSVFDQGFNIEEFADNDDRSENFIEATSDRKFLESLLEGLTEKEEFVIRRGFGIGLRKENLKEIGIALGRENSPGVYAYRIKKEALRKLRDMINERGMSNSFD